MIVWAATQGRPYNGIAIYVGATLCGSPYCPDSCGRPRRAAPTNPEQPNRYLSFRHSIAFGQYRHLSSFFGCGLKLPALMPSAACRAFPMLRDRISENSSAVLRLDSALVAGWAMPAL